MREPQDAIAAARTPAETANQGGIGAAMASAQAESAASETSNRSGIGAAMASAQAEAVASEQGHGSRPRASGAQVVLATFAVLFAMWAARDLLIPLMLAMFFALIGNPIIRALKRIYIPRFLGGVIVLGAGLFFAALMVDQLAEPAATWVHDVPKELHQVAPKFREMLRPMQEASTAAQSVAQAASAGGGKQVQVIRAQIDDPWETFLSAPRWVAAVVAMILLTYFFMVYGESFQRRAIAMLPRRSQKRVTAEILHAIGVEMSRYVLTITLINCVVGALLAGILFFILHVPPQQALLWGTLAALLNFAPYLGPMIGVGVMLLMGMVTFKGLLPSLLPAIIYLGLHVLEGEIVTPIILGRRMAMSPLVLILALMALGWLWGFAGLLLAVPMMVCVKIVLTRIDHLSGWASLLE
jgi:predicted PurR-regulated permease PerM